jgi:hypothetical protein
VKQRQSEKTAAPKAAEAARIDWRSKWEKAITRIALFSGAVRLQEASDALFCAMWANVVDRVSSRLPRLQRQYETAPCGRVRLVVSLKLKAAVGLCYLGLHFQKRIKQRQLMDLGIDELVPQLINQLGSFPVHRSLVSSLEDIPDLLAQVNAVTDQAQAQLYSLYNSVEIHWHTTESIKLRASCAQATSATPEAQNKKLDRRGGA